LYLVNWKIVTNQPVLAGLQVNVMDPDTVALKASYLCRDALELEEMRRMEQQATASSGRKASWTAWQSFENPE
jgi:hypothetical protein